MALMILGLGNDLLGDDAVGLLAADRLMGRFGPAVSIERSAQSGLYLLEHLLGFDDVIIIDSVLGDEPGRVRELDVRGLSSVQVPSAHYAGLPEVLAVARHAGLRMPARLKIVAVEIAGAQTIGSPPVAEVDAAVPEVVDRVLRTAREWGYVGRPGEG